MVVKFKRFEKYRHISCLDLDLHIMCVMGTYYKHTTLLVKYWNRHWKCYQGNPDLVQVKHTDLSKWRQLE